MQHTAELVGSWDFERNSNFFGNDLPKEEIDALIEVHKKMPHNEWMESLPQETLRVYVMSVLWAEEKTDPGRISELYFEGRAWLNYG